MPAAYPSVSANTIVLWGRWFSHRTRLGRDEPIEAVPRFAVNQAGSGTPNLRSSLDEADIKTEKWRTRPLRDGALWAMPLLATNDTQFGAFGGYDITAGDEPSVLVELLENTAEIVLDEEMLAALATAYAESDATPLALQPGDRVQAVWIGHAAVLTTPPPLPVSGFLSAEQTTSLVATSAWRHRGPWSAITPYVRRDAVSYAGTSWLAEAPSTGVAPGGDATWRLLAAKGEKGDRGEKGDQGAPSTVKGDKGERGDVGPANSLAIDTVTTGATGSFAAAEVTGTAPSQKLKLTLPRGEKGDRGDAGMAGTNGTNGVAGAKGDPGLLPEATQFPRTAALSTPANLLGYVNRYALTAATTQALPPVTEGAVAAFAVTAGSTASLTLQAAGTDVFGDGTGQTMVLAPGDFYLMRGQVPSSGVARWRRMTPPLYSEQDAHNDLRYLLRSSAVVLTYASPLPVDASAARTQRCVLTGNPTIAVPTGGYDGQELTFELHASGAARSPIFADGYELGENVLSRIVDIAIGKVAVVRARCRAGWPTTGVTTWRLIGRDNGGL